MKISNLVTQKIDINPNENQITLSVSEKYGIVPQNFLFKKKIALNDRTKYLKVEYGNIVYNPFFSYCSIFLSSKVGEFGLKASWPW